MGGMGYLGYKDLPALQGGQLDPPDLPDPPDLLDPLEMLDPSVGGPSTPGGGRALAHKWKAPS